MLHVLVSIAFISAHRSKWYLFNILVVSSMDSKCRCLVSVLLLSWGNPPTFSDVILLQWSERVSIFPVSHTYLNGTGNFCRFIVNQQSSYIRAEARDIECVHVSVWSCQAGPFLYSLSPSFTFLTKPHHHPRNTAQQACLCNTISPTVAMLSHPSAPHMLILLTHITCENAMWHFVRG